MNSVVTDLGEIEVVGRRTTVHTCLNCGQEWCALVWRSYASGPFCSEICREAARTRPLPWSGVNE